MKSIRKVTMRDLIFRTIIFTMVVAAFMVPRCSVAFATEAPADAVIGADGTVSIMDEVNAVFSAVLKLVVAAISLVITKYAIPFMKNTVVPVIRDTIIPWLEEHHLRSLINEFVAGAEKKGDAGQIKKSDKKEYVLNLLRARGIEITPEIDNWVEAAVQGLGDSFGKLSKEIANALKEINVEITPTSAAILTGEQAAEGQGDGEA